MYSRWYNVAVVILWLSAMSWLLTRKVLPPLVLGEPPSYRTILKARKSNPVVAWKIAINRRTLGWALSTTSRLPSGLTEIRSRVHFDRLPLEAMIPGALLPVFRLTDLAARELCMDAQSTLTLDALGRLTNFDSQLRLDPLDDLIKVKGTVNATELKVSVHAGEFSHTADVRLPNNALLEDAFSPQTHLPGLHPGQTWKVPTYSPFHPLNRPMEILQAKVEGREPIIWGGRTEQAYLVVYRSDPGFGLGSSKSCRGRLWVRDDGTVLMQQVMLFDSTMTFVRLPDDQAATLENEIDDLR